MALDESAGRAAVVIEERKQQRKEMQSKRRRLDEELPAEISTEPHTLINFAL